MARPRRASWHGAYRVPYMIICHVYTLNVSVCGHNDLSWYNIARCTEYGSRRSISYHRSSHNVRCHDEARVDVRYNTHTALIQQYHAPPIDQCWSWCAKRAPRRSCFVDTRIEIASTASFARGVEVQHTKFRMARRACPTYDVPKNPTTHTTLYAAN